MSKKIFLSVIVVNFNGKKFIKECIDSVLSSKYDLFEVVVIDNASTDGSYRYLKKLYSGNKRVRLVRSEKQLYFTGGSNLGASKSVGEKLFFLNSDTTIDTHCLKELANFSQDHPIDLIQPKILNYYHPKFIDSVGGKYNLLGIGHGIGHEHKDGRQYDKIVKIDFANGTAFLIDKKVFFSLGGFDEWFKFHYEDVDLNLRAKKNKGKSWYYHKAVVYHKGSLTIKENLNKDQLLFNVRKNRVRVITKNFKGLSMFIRLSLLLTTYTLLIVKEVVTFKTRIAFLTVKAMKVSLIN